MRKNCYEYTKAFSSVAKLKVTNNEYIYNVLSINSNSKEVFQFSALRAIEDSLLRRIILKLTPHYYELLRMVKYVLYTHIHIYCYK